MVRKETEMVSQGRRVYRSEGVCDRIAMFIANHMMRLCNWSSIPELLLEKMTCLESSPQQRAYEASYPLMNERRYAYTIQVFMHKENEEWMGRVVGYHIYSSGPIYETTFTVDHTDVNIVPIPDLVPFAEMASYKFARVSHE